MKKINIDYITKIEGHAKLHIKIDKGEIKDVKLDLFEGSRYFEGILKAKRFNDMPHIASRICGICSPVHHLTSVKAIEKAFGVEPSAQAQLLKEMLNIGGIIQSHVLHLYFLALPDYTGHSNAVEMARDHPQHIKNALCIKQVGNALVNTVGGRDIHPYTLVPGGFSRIPAKEQFSDLLKKLKECVESAKDAVELFCGIEYPEFERKTKHFALKGKTFFAPTEKIACTGADECFAVPDYEAHFREYFKQGSTSEFARAGEKDYMVGAWSRILNNKELLSKESKNHARCIMPREHNPFMNNPAQAIEILEGMNRCIEIIETTDFKDETPPMFKPKAA
ncbi:MAG: nickel-dependent hydrogenase large subunit, partial [Candidatus Woesearchaeota archaeon]